MPTVLGTRGQIFTKSVHINQNGQVAQVPFVGIIFCGIVNGKLSALDISTLVLQAACYL
jgi:hypothetical protein